MLRAAAFIEPCLPSPADKPPSGSNWIHEIKHDGYRPGATQRSCLIDGEVVCCDERGLAIFSTLRRRRNEARAFLFAFDLLELDGLDMRREPIETRKATLASLLRNGKPGVRLNEHIAHPNGAAVFHHACKLGAEGIVSKRLGSRYRSGRSPDWLKFKNRMRLR